MSVRMARYLAAEVIRQTLKGEIRCPVEQKNRSRHRRGGRHRRRDSRRARAHGWIVRGLTRRPQPARAGHRMDRRRRDERRRRPARRRGRSADRSCRQSAGLSQLGHKVLPMLDNTIAAAKAVGARIVLPGTVYNFGPDAFPVLREDSPQHPDDAQGRDPGRDGAAAARGVARGRSGVDRPRRRFLRPEHHRQQLFLGGDGPARQAGQADRRSRPARRQPRLGLSSRCRRDDRAADGPRERTWRIRNVSFRRSSAWRPAKWRRRSAGDGESASARLAVSLAADRGLQPFVRLFREMAEMRYLWSETIALDGGKLKAFLGEPCRRRRSTWRCATRWSGSVA